MKKRESPLIPGLNRKHSLRTGKPKFGFDTEAEAWVAARNLIDRSARRGLSIDVYLCDECDKWHVGNKPASRRDRRKDDLIMLAFEIGERPAACLIQENMGSPIQRKKKIAQRFTVAERRQLQYHPTPPRKKPRVLP